MLRSSSTATSRRMTVLREPSCDARQSSAVTADSCPHSQRSHHRAVNHIEGQPHDWGWGGGGGEQGGG